MPKWISSLETDHWLRSSVYSAIQQAAGKLQRIRELSDAINQIERCEYVTDAAIEKIELGSGRTKLNVSLQPNLFYRVLGERTGLSINDEGELLSCMMGFAQMKKQYDKIKDAYEEVQNTGYGIVMPGLEELSLEEPEIIRQGGKIWNSPESLRSLRSHDEDTNHNRSYSHCGLGAAIAGTCGVSSAGIRGKSSQNLGIQYFREKPA